MSRTARKEEQLAFVRERILDATVATCAKKGIEGATMADIAAAAGYSAPTLYQYFKSKEDILIALFERLGDQIGATIEEPMPSGLTFQQRLELLTRRQFALVDGREDLPIVFAAMEVSTGTAMNQRLLCSRQDGMTKHMTRLSDWMRRNAKECPDAPRRDPETLAMLYHAIGHALFFRTMRERGAMSAAVLEEIVHTSMDLFLHGAMGDPAAPAAKAKGARKR